MRYAENIYQGYTDCGCNAGFESGVVFDPFAGSGTTLLVAEKLGRRWIGVELNAEYCDIAIKRLRNETDQNKLSFS
jgi:DNA modification methylase